MAVIQLVNETEVKLWDTLSFKILPLIFLIPLTLRILDQTEDIPYIGQYISNFTNGLDIESFFYAVIVFFIGLTSLFEMTFARSNTGGNFVDSLNAGAFIMLASAVLGFILGLVILLTEYPSSETVTIFTSNLNAGWITQFIPYYMLFGVLIFIASAREEIQNGVRLGLKIGRQ